MGFFLSIAIATVFMILIGYLAFPKEGFWLYTKFMLSLSSGIIVGRCIKKLFNLLRE